MSNLLYKLLMGKPEYNKPLKQGIYTMQRNSLRHIWNNEHHHDIGFEKVVRLVLVAIQFAFPGLHVRHYFGRYGNISMSVAVEFYVLLKTLLPLYVLLSGLYTYKALVLLSGYLMTESICYVASLIFVSDMFGQPRSYRRNILMLFFNYVEISLSFAVMYAGLHLLGDKPMAATDYIYFSIVTSTTIGFGDLVPATTAGRMIACTQAVLVVAFVVLFLNFFGSRVETLHQRPRDDKDNEGGK